MGVGKAKENKKHPIKILKTLKYKYLEKYYYRLISYNQDYTFTCIAQCTLKQYDFHDPCAHLFSEF